MRERLEALLQDAAEKELSYADFLDGLLSEEVSTKTAKHVTMRTNLARFPFIKGLDSFDFVYQPSVDRKQIQKLSLCHFVEHGENLVLLGPPGGAEVRGSQADDSGNVSDGRPVDATVVVDAQMRPQRGGQAVDGLATAPTGHPPHRCYQLAVRGETARRTETGQAPV